MSTRRIALFFLLILAWAPPAFAETEVIRGVVVDDEGHPVPGYSLWVSSHDAGPRLWRRERRGDVTDGEGRFEVRGLYPGTYMITGDESTQYAGYAELHVRAGSTLRRLVVARLRAVTGVVRAPDGEPIVRARVTVRPMPSNASEAERRRRPKRPTYRDGFTDANGRFQFERTAFTGRVVVKVFPSVHRRHDLVRLEREDVPVSELEALNITLPRGLRIRGTVKGQDGTPIEGARVKTMGGDKHVVEGRFGAWERTATTDAAGRFDLGPFLPGESVTPIVTPPGDARTTPWFRFSGKQVAAGGEPLAIVLRRAYQVRGRVVGVPPTMLRGLAIIGYVNRSQRSGTILDGSTDTFAVPRMRGRDMRLGVRMRGPAPVAVQRGVKIEDPTVPVVIHARRAHTLYGTVSSRMEPHRIELTFRDALGREHGPIPIDEAGCFVLEHVPAGQGELVAKASAGARVGYRDDVDPARGPVNLHMGSALRIVGRIQGLPSTFRGGSVRATRGTVRQSGRLDSDGWFEVAPLGPGVWRLEFHLREGEREVRMVRTVGARSELLLLDRRRTR